MCRSDVCEPVELTPVGWHAATLEQEERQA